LFSVTYGKILYGCVLDRITNFTAHNELVE